MDQAIAKYLDMRVPRYTSYPTAPHFSAQIGERDLRSWLGEIPATASLSLYLHVPFCKKMCWYCGCNMKLAARYGPVARYVDHLIQEIHLVADALAGRRTVSHIHWGGGTPTTLSPEDFARVDDALRSRFDIAADAEIAVEIDPRTLTEATIRALARVGCNRASLGVQEFDSGVQNAINRVQPFEAVAEVTQQLRNHGIHAVNFDLMYGLPHQTTEMLERTVRQAIALEPDRIALFGYAHVPWMAKNQRMIDESALPDNTQRFEMSERAGALIEALGYQSIGIDHFARADDSLAIAARTGGLRRNFQGYTTDDADALIGLGVSSISALPGGYTQSIVETGAYMRDVARGHLPVAKGIRLDPEDRVRRAIIERIMCDFEVDLSAIGRDSGAAAEDFRPALDRLEPYRQDGLISLTGDQVQLTPRGRPVARVIAAAFDAYLNAAHGEKRHAKI